MQLKKKSHQTQWHLIFLWCYFFVFVINTVTFFGVKRTVTQPLILLCSKKSVLSAEWQIIHCVLLIQFSTGHSSLAVLEGRLTSKSLLNGTKRRKTSKWDLSRARAPIAHLRKGAQGWRVMCPFRAVVKVFWSSTWSLCDSCCVLPTVSSKGLRMSTSQMLKACVKWRSNICSLRPARLPSAFNCTPKRNRYAETWRHVGCSSVDNNVHTWIKDGFC